MLEKYESLNIKSKIFLINELNEIFPKKYKDMKLLERCVKELDLLYDKGILFIIEILYKYKKNRKEICPIAYHFRGTINNLLVLYVLGISNIDPIKYNLPFELFNDNTINVDLIDAIPLDLLSFVSHEYYDKVKFVYGNHDKEDIEEVNSLEDNHYLIIPFLGYKDSPDCSILKDIPFKMSEYLLFETGEDYRNYKKEFLTIRIDEKLPIEDYESIGLENIFTCDFEIEIAKILKPKTINDYVKVKSIGHGVDVWNYNQDVLVKNGKIKLNNLIATREDIFEYLLAHSIKREKALEIVNFIRKGRQEKEPKKWNEYVKLMKKNNCEDLFIDIFSKIKFIFGRGQAVSECLFVLDKENYIEK